MAGLCRRGQVSATKNHRVSPKGPGFFEAARLFEQGARSREQGVKAKAMVCCAPAAPPRAILVGAARSTANSGRPIAKSIFDCQRTIGLGLAEEFAGGLNAAEEIASTHFVAEEPPYGGFYHRLTRKSAGSSEREHRVHQCFPLPAFPGTNHATKSAGPISTTIFGHVGAEGRERRVESQRWFVSMLRCSMLLARHWPRIGD